MLLWSTMGAKLYSNKFGQRQLADRWAGQVAFDDDNKCYSISETSAGEVLVHDITECLRMAKGTGLDAADFINSVVTICTTCAVETVGGDRCIQMDRPVGGPVYWCFKCYALTTTDMANSALDV